MHQSIGLGGATVSAHGGHHCHDSTSITQQCFVGWVHGQTGNGTTCLLLQWCNGGVQQHPFSQIHCTTCNTNNLFVCITHTEISNGTACLLQHIGGVRVNAQSSEHS